MMTREEIVALTKRITYKPNAAFRVFFHEDYATFELCLQVPSVATPSVANPLGQSTIISLSSHRIVPMRFLSADSIPVIALEIAVALETHEMDEWLRIDGEPIRNPHPTVKALAVAA